MSAPPKTWTAGTLTYTSAGLVALFCWLLFGDFAWSMHDRSVAPMAQWYLKQLGVSNVLFGLLISSFPAAINLVFVPVISMKSDRHRGSRGRRIPFLLVTTPIAALGMLGLAATPALAGWIHAHFPARDETGVALVCFGVFWAAFEFATIAGLAVFGGLINDVVPPALLGRFYGLFRAVSLVDGIIFNYWVIGHVPAHFSVILAAVGVFYCAAFFWVCFKVREGEYPPPPAPAAAGGEARGFGAVRTYFRECFGNPYYFSIFAMLMLGTLALTPVNAFAIPYARSVNLSMEAYGRCLALTFLVSFGLSWFLGWLADRFHPVRTSIVALVAYAAVAAWAWQGATTAGTFAVAFVLHAVLSGIYLTSVASLGQRLYPRTHYAQFASAAGMVLSVCTIGLSPLVGLVIDRTGQAYRHVFLVGGLISLVAIGASLSVLRQFLKLGGPDRYRAPE